MQNVRLCVIIASGKRSNRSNQITFAAPETVQQALSFIKFAQKARKTVVFRAFLFPEAIEKIRNAGTADSKEQRGTDAKNER